MYKPFRVQGPRFEWDIAEITLSEYTEDGFLGLQIGGLGMDPGLPTALANHPYGFLGRPATGEEGKSALALVAREGDDLHVWAQGDPSIVAKLPQLTEGGSVQYSRTGTYAVMDGEDGTWTLYVPYAFSGETPTKAHLVQVGLDSNGKPVINIQSGTGASICILDDKLTIKNAAGDTWMSLDSAGGAFAGNWKFAGALDIGATSFPVALAPLVTACLQVLASVFSSWTPVPNDGGAALKTLLTTMLGTGWPASPTVAATMTKGF